MPVTRDIEERLSRSAAGLAKAVRRQLAQWMRQGLTLDEILDQLSAFRLPSTEQTKLRREVQSAMEQIARARGTFRGGDIDTVMAASEITLGDLNKAVRSHLVREVKRTLASGAGVESLRRRLERQEIGNAATLANTAVASFNNILTFQQAAVSGTDTFLYSGPVGPTTRPFCRAHAGKVFTREQIAQMDNNQGLPVAEACGGYNCRHEWVAAPGEEPETAIPTGDW